MQTKKVNLFPNPTLKEYLNKIHQYRQLSSVITHHKSAFRYKGNSVRSKTNSLKDPSKLSISIERLSENSKTSASPPQTKQYFQKIYSKVRNKPIHHNGHYLEKESSEDILDVYDKSSVKST